MTHDGKFCDKWSDYDGYVSIEHDYCRNFDDEKPWCFSGKRKVYCAIKPCNIVQTPTCFTGKGEEYRGKVSVSSSGRKCLQWNVVTPRYSNVGHTFCRNFLGDMDEPWCFVEQGVRERCAVRRCNAFRTGGLDSGKTLITYLVPAIVGISILLFSFFLLAFYWKNKKLIQQKNKAGLVVNLRDTDKLTREEVDLLLQQKTNTLSTNASFEFKKEMMPPTVTSPLQEFTMTNSPSSAVTSTPTPPMEIRQPSRRYKKVSLFYWILLLVYEKYREFHWSRKLIHVKVYSRLFDNLQTQTCHVMSNLISDLVLV